MHMKINKDNIHVQCIFFVTGSDLKALCSESVLKALRRVYPQVYESERALIIDAKNVSDLKKEIIRFVLNMQYKKEVKVAGLHFKIWIQLKIVYTPHDNIYGLKYKAQLAIHTLVQSALKAIKLTKSIWTFN